MDLACNENSLINFNHHQLTKPTLISRNIFHNVGLVIYVKTRLSKANANEIGLKAKAND